MPEKETRIDEDIGGKKVSRQESYRIKEELLKREEGPTK